MKTINLRDYYPFYTSDCSFEVPDEIAELLIIQARYENAYKRSIYRHEAYFSLDRGDGIERDILFVTLSPSEIFERKMTYEQLHAAVASLPDKQAKRIYAHFFLGMSISEIARSEGVTPASVSGSLARGLRSMGKYLKMHP